MRTFIGVLCFTLVIFTKPVELGWPHTYRAVHPLPIQLYIHHYESFIYPGRTNRLVLESCEVGLDENHKYVIGLILSPNLLPLMAPKADLQNTFERVKVRLDGNIANVTVPIPEEDSLNGLFFKRFGPNNIRSAEIRV